MSVHLAADRVFSQRKTNCFAPTAPTSRNRVTGGCIGHRVKPPALFGRKSLPVADRCGDQRRVCIFDGPCENDQFLPEQSRKWRLSSTPFTRGKTALAEARVKLLFRRLGDAIPFHSRKDHTDFVVFLT